MDLSPRRGNVPGGPAAPDGNDAGTVEASIREAGFAHVRAADMGAMLGALPPDAWDRFAATWDRLGPDPFMADGGRDRRRRHGRFAAAGAAAFRMRRLPHAPHYQSLAHNRLNGGIDRLFEPLEDGFAASPVLARILEIAHGVFGRLSADRGEADRLVEIHQFRIEARPGVPGRPTPEGVHRDGVDWVLVMLVRRENAERGETSIVAPDGRPLGSFVLAEPLEAAFVDDRRALHGVTPIRPRDPDRASFRDVLVVTFRGWPDARENGSAPAGG